jgi:iron complex outermembrane receptor protein
MKLVATFIALIFLSVTSLAANLSGLILDADDKTPIPFATVQFIDLNTGVSCDQNGQFEFTGDLPQNILTKVSAVGYETKLVTIASGMDAITIELHHSHIELEEFVVSTNGELQNSTVINVERRGIEELQTIPANDLVTSITNIPSVYNVSTGNGISKPMIRGLSGVRVITYLNGLRIENQQWGGDHGLGINDNGIESVEIIKGPSSLLYGADALGGVLYLKEEAFANQNSIDAYVSSRFESNSLRTSHSAGVKWSGSKLSFNLFANQTTASDYQLPDGNYLKTSRFKQSDIKSSIGFHHKNWLFALRYNYNQNRIGIPGHTHDSIVSLESFISSSQGRENSIPAQVIGNHFGLMENSFYFRNSVLKVRSGITSNHLQEYEEKVTIPGIDMSLLSAFNNVLWDWKVLNDDHLFIGAQTMHQSTSNATGVEEMIIPNATSQDYGSYIMYQGKLKSFHYQLGGRYDQRTINAVQENNSNWNATFSGFNYSAGINTSIKNFTFRTNLASGFRPPHTSETIVSGIHHGTFRYEVGNINLKSEQANQLDLSIEYEAEHLYVSLNPYGMQIANYIYVQPTGATIDGYQVFEYVQDDRVTLYGGDVSLHYHPHFAHRLHLEHNTSMMVAERKDGSSLPLIPPTRTNTLLRYQVDSKGKLSLSYIALQHLYFFEQNKVDLLETTSAAYNLINLSANLVLKTSYPIEFKVGVNNLLNEGYIPHLSRLKSYGIQAPGRNINIGIKINLNKNFNQKQND